MGKWITRYLIFSLIMFFCINVDFNSVHALEWCPSDNPACGMMGPLRPGEETAVVNISDTITCTYKLNNKSTTVGTAPDKISITRKLEASNLDNDKNYIEYDIVDYYDGVKLSNIGNYGSSGYYKKTYACPNSFAFYSADFKQNGKTKVYFSKVNAGSDSWNYNKTISVYSLISSDSSNSGNTIRLMSKNSCNFTNTKNDNQTILVYTEFDSNKPRLNIKYSSKDISDGSEIGSWTILNNQGNALQNIKKAFSSGKCDATYLNYLYYNPDKKGLAFSNSNVMYNNSNDFDGTDEDYNIFINENIRKKDQTKINNVSESWESANKEYDKYCKESSSSYDKEKCKKATQNLKNVATDVNNICNNTASVSQEYKDICSSLTNKVKDVSISTGIDFSNRTDITCETLGELRDKLQEYFTIIKFLVPILIIGLGIVDFIKASASSDDDALKKAGNKFVKRILIGVVIILLPFIIDIILQLIQSKYATSTCGIR